MVTRPPTYFFKMMGEQNSFTVQEREETDERVCMYVCFVVDKAQQQILITKQQQTYVYKNIKMPLINQSFENKRKHNYSQQQK